MADPYLHQRDTLREIDHPELGRLTIFTSPLCFNGNSDAPHSYAPRLGQDNDAFYAAEFGLIAAEIAALRERNVI
jgi:crotonobetainyl-CoA:carnitine CoA-transferase CaiB-like acyl-CoA transferase